jgi:hypothetical protein
MVRVVSQRRSVAGWEVADAIGRRQRAAYERDGTRNVGMSVSDVCTEFGVSRNAAYSALKELQVNWPTRTTVVRTYVDGKPVAHRPRIVYYLVDGEHWVKAGVPMAKVVPVGAAKAETRVDVKAKIASDRASYGRSEFNTYMSGLCTGHFGAVPDK